MPSSIADNRNIVMGAETKIRIRSPFISPDEDIPFGYISGRFGILQEKESCDTAEDAEFFHFDVVRKKLTLDVAFYVYTSMAYHAVPLEFMVRSDAKGRVNIEVNESIEIWVYPKGFAFEPYHAKEFIVEEFWIDTNPKEGGPIFGHIRGESNGPFDLPTD